MATEQSGGNVQTGPFGSQLHASDYVEDGIPSIMPKNIGENHIDTMDIARVSRKDAERLNRYRVQIGDIVYSRRGDVERRALIREAEDGWLCGTGCLRVRFGDRTVDPTYVSYYLGHPQVRAWIVRHAHGATMANLNTSILSSLPLALPPIDEQRAIAHILGTLDEKIELNRQMNLTLDEIARTLFRSWFVDFDPVRAKAEGRQPEGMDAETAALFPDRFVDSELGPIPEGWERSTVGTIAEVVDCLHSKKPERTSSGPTLLQLSNIRDDGLLDLTDRYAISETDYRRWTSRMEARSGDCVITNVGRVGAVSQVPDGVTAALGRNMTGIRCRQGFPYPAFLVTTLLSDAMRREIDAKTDSGTILNALNVRNIPTLRLTLPKEDVLRAFEQEVRPIRHLMEHNVQESRTLAELRDTLLPELLSGRIRSESESIALDNS
jgi:type I restriction enzyme S subunit